MVALAAISFGSVFAHPAPSKIKTTIAQDTTKKMKKKPQKMKKKKSKSDTTTTPPVSPR